MLSLDFHCKENEETTGAAHLIQTFLEKNQTPFSPDIRRYRQKSLNHVLQLFRHFPYNENSTRALNTTLLKYCSPSTDAIDREEKNSCMHMKVKGRLMQARFIKIHQVTKNNNNNKNG